MLKKASASAAGQNMGRSKGVAGARDWHQDVIVNMPTVYDLNQVLACSIVDLVKYGQVQVPFVCAFWSSCSVSAFRVLQYLPLLLCFHLLRLS